MPKIIAAALAALLVFAAAADEPKFVEKVNFAKGRWETANSAAKRFDTPLGTLFRFQPRRNFLIASTRPGGEYRDGERHGRNCPCVYCAARFALSSIQCPIPQNTAKGRFLAFEFVIRNFPAFTADQRYVNTFTINFGKQSSVGDDLDNLQSVLRVSPAGAFFISSNQSLIGPYYNEPLSLSTGERYMPPFEPLHVRLIFDTRSNGLIYLVINGSRLFIGKAEDRAVKNPPRIRSFGIMIEKGDESRSDVDAFVEVSEPRVGSFELEETLPSLLDMKHQPYPYQLFDQERKLANSRNPDYLYYCALKLLYGAPDTPPAPEKGIELLRRAASDNHSPSLYRLGLCYFRGLGVEADLPQALKLLETARQYGSPDAEALIALIEFQRNRPLFLWPDEVKEKILRPRGGTGHDAAHWRDILEAEGPAPMPLEYSFRSAMRGALDYGHDSIRTVYRKPGDTERADYFKSLRPELLKCVYPSRLPVRLNTGANEDRYLGFDLALAEEAVKADYAPAMYALAVALDCAYPKSAERQNLKIDRRIDGLLAEAAARKFSLAVLEQIRINLIRGEDPRGLITPQLAFEFAEEPWFLGLLFAIDHPGFPGIAEFLNHQPRIALNILFEQRETAETRYFSGLLKLMHPSGPQKSLLQRARLTGNPYQSRTFECFVPMQESNVHAQYLVGKFLLENPRELPMVKALRDSPYQSEAAAILQRGPRLLRQAADAGHLKAQYLLALNEKNRLEALRLLEEPCRAMIPEARLLRAQILRQFRPRPEVLQAYQDCAALGIPEALSYLALNTTDPEQKTRLYREFLRLDRERRENDIFDFYASRHLLKQQWINSDLLNIPPKPDRN
ncbi:MAG: hypothetical protein AB7F32_10235 [Victivallaceae bacterium]